MNLYMSEFCHPKLQCRMKSKKEVPKHCYIRGYMSVCSSFIDVKLLMDPRVRETW